MAPPASSPGQCRQLPPARLVPPVIPRLIPGAISWAPGLPRCLAVHNACRLTVYFRSETALKWLFSPLAAITLRGRERLLSSRLRQLIVLAVTVRPAKLQPAWEAGRPHSSPAVGSLCSPGNCTAAGGKRVQRFCRPSAGSRQASLLFSTRETGSQDAPGKDWPPAFGWGYVVAVSAADDVELVALVQQAKRQASFLPGGPALARSAAKAEEGRPT